MSPSSRFRLVCLSAAFALLFAVGVLLGPSRIAGSAPSEDEIDLTLVEGKEFTNSIGMSMKRIPKGKFMMGSPNNERGRGANEQQHEVTITKAFFMSATEVTQGQWKKIMGNNPSGFSRTGSGAGVVKGFEDAELDDFPVETVSWNDTQEFLKKLNARAQERSHSRTYRLPSEAEWEYACRGGVGKAFCTGDDLTVKDANVVNALNRTCKVGSYKANAFGLYDMHGNVFEWCNDWFDDNYYKVSPRLDPRGPANGSQRVARGGRWSFSIAECRSAYRAQGSPTERHSGLAFRVACDVAR